jgi:3-hydroxyisobutyrate dehydrogenase-like beta-hydroxyacid dehydrogenase
MSTNEKIAFVGVGRMGANMARRLKDCGYSVTAVFDAHAPTAAALARELGARPADSLAAVTAAADVIFTVVTDDAAQLAHAENPRRSRAPRQTRRRCHTRGLHGLVDSAGP